MESSSFLSIFFLPFFSSISVVTFFSSTRKEEKSRIYGARVSICVMVERSVESILIIHETAERVVISFWLNLWLNQTRRFPVTEKREKKAKEKLDTHSCPKFIRFSFSRFCETFFVFTCVCVGFLFKENRFQIQWTEKKAGFVTTFLQKRWAG